MKAKEEISELNKKVKSVLIKLKDPKPFIPFKLRDLVDTPEICKQFRLSHQSLALMQNVGLPTVIFIPGENKAYRKFGMVPGERYYLPAEFQYLQESGKLREFQIGGASWAKKWARPASPKK